MRNKKEFISTVATTVLSALLVAGVVMATTTLSANIVTEGNLTVSGNTILGDTAADTITVLGKTTVASTGTPLNLGTTATNKALQIYTTSSSASATYVEPFYMKNIMTAAGGTGGRAKFELSVNGVTLGGAANALKAYADFGTAGSGTSGLASAFVAELKMPNGAAAGAYFPLEIEYVDQASTAITPIGSTAGFIYMAASGTVTDFNDDGYFMKVDGLTGDTNHLLSLTSQTLRASIGAGNAGNRYLMLSQMQDGLGLGNSTTSMDLSTTATNKAIEVYTTSGSTTAGTSVTPIYMESVMTGAGGVGGRAEFLMTTAVKLGGWANALKGRATFSDDTGEITGLASAVCAEMDLPNKTMMGGVYYPLEIELTPGASSASQQSATGNNIGFIYAKVNTNTTDFRNNGYIMNLQGLGTSGAGEVFDTIGSVTPTHQLRILIDNVEYFIMLQATQ